MLLKLTAAKQATILLAHIRQDYPCLQLPNLEDVLEDLEITMIPSDLQNSVAETLDIISETPIKQQHEEATEVYDDEEVVEEVSVATPSTDVQEGDLPDEVPVEEVTGSLRKSRRKRRTPSTSAASNKFASVKPTSQDPE